MDHENIELLDDTKPADDRLAKEIYEYLLQNYPDKRISKISLKVRYNIAHVRSGYIFQIMKKKYGAELGHIYVLVKRPQSDVPQ